MKSFFVILLIGFSLVGCTKSETPAAPAAGEPGQIKPTITLSRERIPDNGWFKMYGKGFTPRQNVLSHLRRPDGTEFRELAILTNDRGEFEHDIENKLLLRGVHDLWVVDPTTGLTSNVAHFDATDEAGPILKPTHPTW